MWFAHLNSEVIYNSIINVGRTEVLIIYIIFLFSFDIDPFFSSNVFVFRRLACISGAFLNFVIACIYFNGVCCFFFHFL